MMVSCCCSAVVQPKVTYSTSGASGRCARTKKGDEGGWRYHGSLAHVRSERTEEKGVSYRLLRSSSASRLLTTQ